MSLLRSIIIVSAVIAVMPSDPGQQEKFHQKVADAAHWSMTICERNARTCDTASVAWEKFKEKAEFAGGMAYTLAMTHVFSDPNRLTTASMNHRATATEGSAGGTDRHSAAQSAPVRHDLAPAPARGTLTDHDMQPDWRGTVSRKGI